MKALKCKTLGGIRTRRLWMYVLHHAQSLTPHHCSSICRVSAPRVQNCIRVRMRSPSVLPYAKYGAIFASSYLACYTPDAKAVGSPTVPEVHHTCTILFAAEFLPARVAVNTIFPHYIFTQTFLRMRVARPKPLSQARRSTILLYTR